MPINTVKCPHCGARVNHIVKADDAVKGDFSQTLDCPRCKKQFVVNSTSLSMRTIEGVKELAAFSERMSQSETEFEKAFGDDKGDSVEEALNKADAVFKTAKRALDEISLDQAAETIDAEELLQQYSVPDVKQFAMGKAQQAARKAQDRYGFSDAVVDRAVELADQGYDKAAQKLSEKYGDKVRSALG